MHFKYIYLSLSFAVSLQDEYSMAKRNKPSLSIVNPLDVLRQRLLLEIARRQMKENTRQVREVGDAGMRGRTAWVHFGIFNKRK